MSLSAEARRELAEALRKSAEAAPQGPKPYPSEEQIQAQFRKEFAASERVIGTALILLQMRGSGLVLDYSRPATAVFPFLWPKAIKCAHSVSILAAKGYGEDAVVLARSLVNLCIDLTYIFDKDADERAKCWLSYGLIERRKRAQRVGDKEFVSLVDDWPTAEKRAKKWKDVKIFDRARECGHQMLYEIWYSYGSSFEHSDSSSIDSFVEMSDLSGPFDLRICPGLDLVRDSLKIASVSVAQTVDVFVEFYGLSSDSLVSNAVEFMYEGIDDAFASPSAAV